MTPDCPKCGAPGDLCVVGMRGGNTPDFECLKCEVRFDR